MTLYDAQISPDTVTKIDLAYTTFELAKPDSDAIWVSSPTLGVNESCASTTCYFKARVVSGSVSDLTFSYNGVTTAVKSLQLNQLIYSY